MKKHAEAPSREIPFDDFYADAPVTGTLRECRDVEDGWRGVMEDGREIHCRHHDPDRLARLPEHDKIAVGNGTMITGVLLLERAANGDDVMTEGNPLPNFPPIPGGVPPTQPPGPKPK
jgi:hypothetical protein